MRALKKFWEKDTDTILYTAMCILTVPALIIGAGFLWFVENSLPPQVMGCMFLRVLHLYCPGCGGTRFALSLVRGELLTALYYHPAAFYGVALYVIYFVSQTLMRVSRGRIPGMKLRPVYLYVMLGLMAVNFVVRNVLLVFFDIATL